jgi:fermentation-respiration switch protein FrsA (DUF1100 family)
MLIGLSVVFYIVLPIRYAKAVAQPKRVPICCTTPADRGFDYENISFVTPDGLTLHGWYIPSQNTAAIIVSHGIGGNRVSCLEQGTILAKHGYGVLLIDLRAHGDSDGDKVSFGGNDIVAAADYLKHKDDVNPRKIGAMGVSLGGLVTIQAAAIDEDIKAVVADGSAANTIQDLPMPATLGHWLDLPFQWVTFSIWEQKGVTASLSTIEAIERIAPRPILLIAGTRSEFEQAMQRKLYAAAGEPKLLWEVPDAGHAENWSAEPDEYEKRIILMFNQALLPSE